MKTNANFFSLLLNAIIAGALLISANGAAYLKFDGVDGEAKDEKHRGWIDILAVSQGIRLTQPGGGATGATRRRGGVILEDLSCSKELDKASPKIAEAICKGKVFPKVDIELTRDTEGGRVTYYKYELKNVMVTSYNVSIRVGENGEDVPVEDFALNFEEIKVTYTEVDQTGKKKGNIEYSWKVEEGEKAAVPTDERVAIAEELAVLEEDRSANEPRLVAPARLAN